MESIYEYGSRAGVWRLLREFEKRRLPLTVFAIGMALERNPEAARAFVELGHDIACHGYRWIHYQTVPEDIEREHMQRCIARKSVWQGKSMSVRFNIGCPRVIQKKKNKK